MHAAAACPADVHLREESRRTPRPLVRDPAPVERRCDEDVCRRVGRDTGERAVEHVQPVRRGARRARRSHARRVACFARLSRRAARPSGSQRRADRGTRPRRGSRSGRRAPRTRARPSPTSRGPSATCSSSTAATTRVELASARTGPRLRRHARERATARSSSSVGSAVSGASGSASGSTNVTSIRVPVGCGHEQELISLRHGLLHDRGSERCEQVALQRTLERPCAELGAEALVDQECVRGVVHLDGPRPAAQSSPRERVRELLVEKRAHGRALEGAEDDDTVEPVEELGPERGPHRSLDPPAREGLSGRLEADSPSCG